MKGNNMKKLYILITIGIVIYSTFLKAQWIQTNGLEGGDVSSFVVSGINLFAGTINSGVFISTNNGDTWSKVNAGLTNLYISSLAVSGPNLFAGTFEGGIFRSTNNGEFWVAVNTGLTEDAVNCLAVSATNIFAGTGGRLSPGGDRKSTRLNSSHER